MKTYSWEAFCAEERYSAINKIETLVNQYGAITDFHRFSDLSLSLTIEISPEKANILFDELSKDINISGKKPLLTEFTSDILLFISINFAEGKGDLKVEVPDVPG